MSGPVLDPLIFVVDSNGQAVAADDNTGGGKDAEVLIQLTAGAWTVIATSGTTTLGDYKIDISSEAPRSCTPTSTLDLDASVEA
ncbi:MAG: hypothetical protein H7Y20_14420, partial [Bryobacteraceae bacterium]|nr:hypothetical protein [Bryobacteraceae bacterium]